MTKRTNTSLRPPTSAVTRVPLSTSRHPRSLVISRSSHRFSNPTNKTSLNKKPTTTKKGLTTHKRSTSVSLVGQSKASSKATKSNLSPNKPHNKDTGPHAHPNSSANNPTENRKLAFLLKASTKSTIIDASHPQDTVDNSTEPMTIQPPVHEKQELMDVPLFEPLSSSNGEFLYLPSELDPLQRQLYTSAVFHVTEPEGKLFIRESQQHTPSDFKHVVAYLSHYGPHNLIANVFEQ